MSRSTAMPQMACSRPAMSKPGPISAKPLSVLLGDVFSDAYAKQGFASRELVTRWAEIAGAEIAAHSRAAENPVAAPGRRPAAGTGDAGAAGRRPDGAGNPARLRRDPAAGQPLLRLERGRPAGAAAGAAVAPRQAAQAAARRRMPPAWRRSPKRCPPWKTTICARRWPGSAPRSSEIEAAVAITPRGPPLPQLSFQASDTPYRHLACA